MSKKSGAQAGESKLESRFAALTSGLLARKGQAAPSNSPLIDAAEETEAFTLGNALIPRKHGPKEEKGKPPGLSPPTISPRTVAPAPPARPALAPEPPRAAPMAAPLAGKPPAKVAPAPARAEPVRAPSALAPAPRPQLKPATAAPPPQPLTVINERSFEAGYPDNPSAEEIAAIDAEADEVASYFENFGDEATDLDNEHFFDGDVPAAPARDPLDDLDDDFDAVRAPAVAPSAEKSAAALAGVRATVSAQLGARAFLRLSLGAAEMQMSADELIAEAIEEYLDARGVDSLGGEEFLKRLASAGGKASEE